VRRHSVDASPARLQLCKGAQHRRAGAGIAVDIQACFLVGDGKWGLIHCGMGPFAYRRGLRD